MDVYTRLSTSLDNLLAHIPDADDPPEQPQPSTDPQDRLYTDFEKIDFGVDLSFGTVDGLLMTGDKVP